MRAEALEFAEEQELSLEMMGRVRRALRRIEDAGGAGVMEGALSTMTEEDIEKFRMERDERHAKAANPRYGCNMYEPPTDVGVVLDASGSS